MEITDDKIELVVELKAPVSRVWRAIADYKEFGEWFHVALDQPFEPGGKSTGKITHPDAEGMVWLAEIEKMEPERLFSMRWNIDDLEDGETELPSILVEFILEPMNGGTRLTIRESGFSAVPDPQRLEYMRRNAGGWEEQAKNITAYVEA